MPSSPQFVGEPLWPFQRPSPTVVTTRRSKDGILVGRQLAGDDRQDVGGKPTTRGLQKGQLPGVRLNLREAAILQTYPTHLPPEKEEFVTERKAFEEIMELVPEGGNWRDLPDEMLAEAMGGAFHSGGGKTGYFRRLHRDLPSPTIVGSPAQKSTLLWHPTENRPINEVEAAAMQTYPTHLKKEELVSNHLVALDLFSGTGWGVACRWLGIKEYGVDNMPEVVATREANGMETIFRDVWTGLLDGLDGGIEVPRLSARALHAMVTYTMLIASPPCQTFSMAGKGEGRKALDRVLQAIEEKVYTDPVQLYKLTEITDPRTALVLTPLAYAYRDRPAYIVFEQVPTVLPVWEACADVLRSMGYSAWTGILNAEQYGVPQTRKRAILIARRDGVEAAPPVPTHSKYYNRDPKRLDDGVQKWVSMAEALGWDTDDVTLRSNYGTGGDPENRGERALDAPAPTVTSKVDRNKWVYQGNQKPGGRETYQQRSLEEPAPTITAMASRNKIVASGPTPEVEGDTSWVENRPSPTIVGSFRPDVVAAPGYRRAGDPPRQKTPGSVRITVEDAETLQSYPPMEWVGTKSKIFLQLGNAVPPVLARAILETFV